MGRLAAPPIPEIPEPVRGKSFVVVEADHVGDPAQADELLAPLRRSGRSTTRSQTIPMPALSHLHMDPEHPVPGTGDGMMLGDLPGEAVDTFVEVAGADARFPLLTVELRHLGGELGRAHPENGALASIDAEYALYAVGMTPSPSWRDPVAAQVRCRQEGDGAVGGSPHVPQLRRNRGDPASSGASRPTSGCDASRPGRSRQPHPLKPSRPSSPLDKPTPGRSAQQPRAHARRNACSE